MLQRPLFSPTRRPPASALDAPPPSLPTALPVPLPPPPPALALSGIVMGDGVGVALVQRPGDAAPIRVAVGGRVDGWMVAEIRPRAVVLRLGDRSVTVALPSR